MSICPSEPMHFLLHALKDKDREAFSLCLAELLLWLQVPGNPMPAIRTAVVTESAMGSAEETLREKAQSLRAMMRYEPSLSRRLEDEAAEHEQIADALRPLSNGTDFIACAAAAQQRHAAVTGRPASGAASRRRSKSLKSGAVTSSRCKPVAAPGMSRWPAKSSRRSGGP